MIEQVITLVIVSLLSACLGALLTLPFQSRYWNNFHAQHDGWEHAQQGHHRSWEEKQEKLIAEVEARFTAQVRQLHNDWLQWEIKDTERIADNIRQQKLSAEHSRLERELARLPHVEETSMALSGKNSQEQASLHWQPAMLLGANLADHDFSHRYLGRADMRSAQLSRANFFMADLSGACLADANLSEVDLSGANLSNADLRGATLTGANLLVADLNNAILPGADLRGTRNLTTQQLYTTIYDSTTQLDAEIDITVPRTSSTSSISRIHNIHQTFPSTPPNTELPSQEVTPLLTEAKPGIEPISEETAPVIAEIAGVAGVAGVEHVLEQAIAQERSSLDDAPEQTILPQNEPELLPSSSTASDDKQLSQEEINLLVEIREGNHTDKSTTTTSRSKRKGRKRAKVG